MNKDEVDFMLIEFMNLAEQLRSVAHETLDELQCRGDFTVVLDHIEAEVNFDKSLNKVKSYFER